ncbi:MAG: hypothetical protein J3K34DRAFT_498347 [Monoraphidium minutum]|nr:MAG: hypothetical protein J3K34DRAFT_498347 [Monoraphidium minutum]
MAAQLYAETQIAECLYEVLNELVDENAIEESLAVATLNQLSESILSALTSQIPAKADIKATLSTYRYLDNVWQFVMTNVAFRLNAAGHGSLRKAAEVRSDKVKLVCVDAKLAQAAPDAAAAGGAAGGSGAAAAAGGGA